MNDYWFIGILAGGSPVLYCTSFGLDVNYISNSFRMRNILVSLDVECGLLANIDFPTHYL